VPIRHVRRKMAKITFTIETDNLTYDEREALSVLLTLKPSMAPKIVVETRGPGKIHLIKMLRSFAIQMAAASGYGEGESPASMHGGKWAGLKHCKVWYENYAVTGWGFDK
jgi:hypothetical protein